MTGPVTDDAVAEGAATGGAMAGGPGADGAAPGDPLFAYIERFAAVLVAAGFPPMPARVFVALLVTDSGRLSAAELAAMLRISPAAVSGAVLATIRKKVLALTDTLEIEHDGAVAATVRKALFSPLHHRANIEIPGRGELEAVGNIIDKDFEIRDGDQVIAQVSRSWFRIRDTYGVDVAPGENDALIICIAICLDRIHDIGREH